MRAPAAWLTVVVALGGFGQSAEEPTGHAPPIVSDARTIATSTAPPPSLDALPAIAGLHYAVLYTGKAHAGERLPTVVAIHGRCDNPASYAHVFAGLHESIRVVLPYAVRHCEGIDGYSWFEVDQSPDRQPDAWDEAVRGAVPTVAAFLEALPQELPIVGRPILTGFSQGGMLTHGLTAQHPELIELAAPVAGFLPTAVAPPPRPRSPELPRVVAFHGADDTAVRVEWERKSIDTLVRGGFSAEQRTYPGVGHTFGTEELADYLGLLDDTARRMANR